MPTLDIPHGRIDVLRRIPISRSDWVQGIQHRRYRSQRSLRTWRLVWEALPEAQFRRLKDLYTQAGMGAGEVDWPGAPGGSVKVRFLSMPASYPRNSKFMQVTVELEELLTTDS